MAIREMLRRRATEYRRSATKWIRLLIMAALFPTIRCIFLTKGLIMLIAGKRLKRTRLIRTEKYVVAVDVEMVVPLDDPSEPCYESHTIELLKEVKDRAEQGDIEWLMEKGKVYAAVNVA